MMRAGAEVRHIPSGETWLLAVDSENGRVSWSGWPEGMADDKADHRIYAARRQLQLGGR